MLLSLQSTATSEGSVENRQVNAPEVQLRLKVTLINPCDRCVNQTAEAHSSLAIFLTDIPQMTKDWTLRLV
jgi:hypothetical protein